MLSLNISKTKIIFLFLTLFSTFAVSSQTENKGGIALGATRIVYPLGSKQVSLPIINYSLSMKYLINSWVDGLDDKKTSDFVVTPPLFVIATNTENTIRIVNTAESLPTDRETLYWLNVKAIPSVDKSMIENNNVLQIAVLSKIKIFVRPTKLPYKPEAAYEKITFIKRNGEIVIKNPTPYYMNIVNIMVNNKQNDNVMVPPLSEKSTAIKLSGKISYQIINDYGALTPPVELTLN